MARVLARASARHLRQHPWQFGLAALGVALGVALAVGVEVAGASVRRAFALSTEAISGRATHEIVGGPRGVPEALYRRLRVDEGLRAVAPFVGGGVALGGRNEVAQVIGVDPFAEGALRPDLAFGGPAVPGGGRALAALLTRPGAAMISAGTAARWGVVPGTTSGTLAVRVGTARRVLTVVAVFRSPDPGRAAALDGVVLVDIASAQELLGEPGWLGRIDLAAPGPALLARLGAILPPGVRIQAVAARTGALLAMTRAFDVNLQALSLLALLVGAFLIYNSQTFSVVQRRPLLATLRTLGATRGEILRLVLVEAAVVGALGTAAGLVLGVLMGRGLVGLVARAVSDLYFVVSVREVALPGGVLVRGALLGLFTAVLAALPAGREAARAEPRLALMRSTLEEGTRRSVGRLAGVGALLGGAVVALLAWPGRGLVLAFMALLLTLIAAALAAPAATLGAMRLLGRPLGRVLGLPGRMAAREAAASLSRTGVAVAALMVALAVTVGVSGMVRSFRGSVVAWLGQTLHADVYVTAPALVAARNDARLPRAWVDRLGRLPGVARVTSARGVTMSTPAGPVAAGILDVDRLADTLLAGDRAAAFQAFQTDEAILISESLAYLRGLKLHDRLVLATGAGPRPFRVVGVYRDYGSSAGALLMSRRTYDRHFDDPYVSSVALDAAPGVSVDELVARARAAAGPGEELLVRSNRALRTATLEIFDRTFEVTEVLRLLALVVAAFGVASALMARQLERTRELGLLRALGFTSGQVAQLVTVETGLLGLVAGLLAMPVGALVAAGLVYVINRRSFGWTMDLALGPRVLGLAPLLGLAAGLAGGIYPAWRMARAVPADALRDE